MFYKNDLISFITAALQKNWVLGLKAMIACPFVQFLFTTISHEDKKLIIEDLLKKISQIEKEKLRKDLTHLVIDGELTKRPYVQILSIVLLDNIVTKEYDTPRLARECLKSLTSEDLM